MRSVCGDPSCAPIDTVFTLVWTSGGKGMFALPAAINEVTQEDLMDNFPVSALNRVHARNIVSGDIAFDE